MSPATKPIERAAVPPEQLALAREICRPNLVKQLMRENKLAHSFGMRIAFSTEMPLVAKRAGYSAVLMNLEHMAMSIETMKDVAVSCLNVGITPMVVVPTCSSEWISRCLDSAAQAIIVPHVNNVEQALMCVNASKFPPLGHRSVTMVTAMTQYTTNLSYAAIGQVVNDEVMIMPMIETQEGIENVEAIAAVPGIDALLIGCADLCMEFGIPGEYDSELFHSLVAKVATAAEKASTDGRQVFVGLGGLEPRPDLLETLVKRHPSIRFAMAGRDLALLLAGMSKQAAAMNEISKRLTTKDWPGEVTSALTGTVDKAAQEGTRAGAAPRAFGLLLHETGVAGRYVAVEIFVSWMDGAVEQ